MINEFCKKISAETGEDAKKKWSEQEIAEEIANYVTTAFLTVENLPVSIISNVQQEPKVQTQGQSQAEVPAQAEVTETPAQPTEEAPAQSTETPAQPAPAQEAEPAQTPSAEATAQKIPQAPAI